MDHASDYAVMPVSSTDPVSNGEPLVARTPEGLNLSVRAFGDPANSEILFVHGLGQSRLSWARQTGSVLATKFRLVTYDLRGHGESEKPASPEAYADGARWADDLRAVIDAAGLRRPFLVGWSLGGLVIGHYIVRHGHGDIAGVNLVNAVTKLSPELLSPLALGYAEALASEDIAIRSDAIGGFLSSCFATLPPEQEFRRMLVFNGMVPRCVQQGIVRITSDGLDQAWQRLPRLLVSHGEEDRHLRPEMSTRLLNLNDRAQLSIYPDAGHSPFYEQPGQFNRELANFVAG